MSANVAPRERFRIARRALNGYDGGVREWRIERGEQE
jgi:hypothetical protein